MNNALRYVVIALVLVAGLFVLVVCADGLCSACSHAFDDNADRSKPLLRLARRLRALSAAVSSEALAQLSVIPHSLPSALTSLAPIPALERVVSLRI